MAELPTHINYSFDDIQRYLKGKMNTAEMHSIEKAALQDPFLADAIEGYNKVDTVTATQHLNQINISLLNEKKKSRVITFNRKTQWLRIAALIILLAGVGLIGAYFLKNPNKHQQIAQVKKDSGKVLQNDSNLSNADTLHSAKQDATVLMQNEKKHAPLSSALSKKENNAYAFSTNKSLQADETTEVAGISEAPAQQNEDASNFLAAVPSSNKEIDSLQQILEGKTSEIKLSTKNFTGKVLDQNGKPIAGAVVILADKKEVITDLNGSFSVQRDDSILNVTASTVGYERTKTAMQPGVENFIILPQTNAALSEVMVTGYGTSKLKQINAAPVPVGGWKNFNNYVVSELNKDSTTANIIPQKDLVEIEFLIDNLGNPYNIKIVKPLDGKRNSKAIEILKTGPKWTTTKKNKKARVVIPF